MKAAFIIFMIVATIFAIASILYIIVDIILEKRKKEQYEEYEEVEEPSEEVCEEPAEEINVEPIIVPVVAAPIEEVMPEIVDHIDAEEADAMISDDLAIQNALYEEGAGEGMQDIINIGTIDVNFKANDIITLDALKQKGLISKKAGRMKILADGILTKPITVKAESYSVQAIKMIELTGGKVIILKD